MSCAYQLVFLVEVLPLVLDANTTNNTVKQLRVGQINLGTNISYIDKCFENLTVPLPDFSLRITS